MTDGPFKGLKLTAPQKKLVESVGDIAFDDSERVGRLSHACLQDLAKSGDMKLVANLKAQAANDQMDLDPAGTVKRVFAEHEKSAFSNRLEQNVVYLVQHGASPEKALNEALPDAVQGQVRDCVNRINEELMRARDAGDAKPDQVAQATQHLRRVEGMVPIEKACSALLDGNKDAFKDSVQKKQGDEEGPSL
ncbi:MAG: hypothetical protein RKK11_05095 [Alphaproteobacteria bacterium]